MDELTTDELRRIQHAVRSRFRISSRTNIVDVGFGTAIRAGKFEPSRGLCITFLVQAKKAPRKKSERIPQEVNVRVKRGRRFVSLSFRSDVVEVGRIVATGSRLDYRRKTATTGVIVAWKGPSSSKLTWGLLTVGHLLPRGRSLSKLRRKVTIRTGRGPFFGTLIAKSDGNREIDAAIALVEREDLVANKLLRASQSARGIVVRKLTKLVSDQNKAGKTLRVGGTRPFTVHAYFPTLRVTGIGSIAHIVSVLAAAAQTFEKGTSGSSWLIQNQAACIQIAGRTPDFRQGFGQSLASVLEWAAKELQQQDLMQSDSFRIVATF